MTQTASLIAWLQSYSIRHLCLDSRIVEAGDAFIVLAGTTHDASCFVHQAIERGITALLVEAGTRYAEKKGGSPDSSIPYLIVPNLREQLSSLADAWYNQPSASLSVIGVTGTNGKTSSVQWIAKGLEQSGFPAGTIGTLGCTGLKSPPKHDHTTPDTLSLHRWLQAYHRENIKTVALEVSSHALDQHRAKHVHFHTALFTNVSRDHLDYHSSLEAYAETKARLFTEYHVNHAVINVDDVWGQVLSLRWKHHHPSAPLLTYGLDYPADLGANVRDTPAGLEIILNTPYGKDNIVLPCLNGRFNVLNVLGVIGVWLHLGLSWEHILTLLPYIQPVPGRMNTFGGKKYNAPTIIVDYAHTPDALEKVLLALHPLRNTTGGKLWCVFGAGGDRDPGKRSLMGTIAVKYADKIVITSDNPRSEEPHIIAQAIYAGVPADFHQYVEIEVNRRHAIITTLNAASPDDIILIAGKGHEDYQEIKGVRNHFSDSQEVESWLNAHDLTVPD